MRSRFVGEIYKEDCYSLCGTLLDPVQPLNKNLPACSSPIRGLVMYGSHQKSDSKEEYKYGVGCICYCGAYNHGLRFCWVDCGC